MDLHVAFWGGGKALHQEFQKPTSVPCLNESCLGLMEVVSGDPRVLSEQTQRVKTGFQFHRLSGHISFVRIESLFKHPGGGLFPFCLKFFSSCILFIDLRSLGGCLPCFVCNTRENQFLSIYSLMVTIRKRYSGGE